MTLASSFASLAAVASLVCASALVTGCSGGADGSSRDAVSGFGSSGGESSTASATTNATNGASGASNAASESGESGEASSGLAANHGVTKATGDDAGASDPGPIDAGGCPALTYPSGVTIQTFPDAATTATYADHLATGEAAPTCFLDANDLINPETREVYALTVNVSANFQLAELVGTEIDQGYGHFVLAVPSAVAALETFRESVDESVSVISGFRSPKHQEDTCTSLCGNPLGCSGTCANNSRHMFGDAFDLPMSFYTSADQTLACTDGFKFSYLESGTHLHVDQNPAYATCVKE